MLCTLYAKFGYFARKALVSDFTPKVGKSTTNPWVVPTMVGSGQELTLLEHVHKVPKSLIPAKGQV